MISWFVSLSHISGSVLAAQSLEPASYSVSPFLSVPLPLTICLSQSCKNKQTLKKKKRYTVYTTQLLSTITTPGRRWARPSRVLLTSCGLGLVCGLSTLNERRLHSILYPSLCVPTDGIWQLSFPFSNSSSTKVPSWWTKRAPKLPPWPLWGSCHCLPKSVSLLTAPFCSSSMSTAPAAYSSWGELPTPPSPKGGGLGISSVLGPLCNSGSILTMRTEMFCHHGFHGLCYHSEIEAHRRQEIYKRPRSSLESVQHSE